MGGNKTLSPGVAYGVIAVVVVLCIIVGFFALGGGGPEHHPQPGPAKIPPRPAAVPPPAWVLDKLKGK